MTGTIMIFPSPLRERDAAKPQGEGEISPEDRAKIDKVTGLIRKSFKGEGSEAGTPYTAAQVRADREHSRLDHNPVYIGVDAAIGGGMAVAIHKRDTDGKLHLRHLRTYGDPLTEAEQHELRLLSLVATTPEAAHDWLMRKADQAALDTQPPILTTYPSVCAFHLPPPVDPLHIPDRYAGHILLAATLAALLTGVWALLT